MRRKIKGARAGDNRKVDTTYEPLTDAKLALEYAEALKEMFRVVVVKQQGKRIVVVAHN